MNTPMSSSRWQFRIALGLVVCGSMVVPLSPTSARAAELGLGKLAGTMEANLAGPPVIRVGSYDPSRVYTGAHEPQRIYKLDQSAGMWRVIQRPALLREVSCRDARHALEQDGVWTGWLASDGACRVADDTRWATGNYLNFQAGPQTSDVHL
jgi:hypothetical protein